MGYVREGDMSGKRIGLRMEDVRDYARKYGTYIIQATQNVRAT